MAINNVKLKFLDPQNISEDALYKDMNVSFNLATIFEKETGVITSDYMTIGDYGVMGEGDYYIKVDIDGASIKSNDINLYANDENYIRITDGTGYDGGGYGGSPAGEDPYGNGGSVIRIQTSPEEYVIFSEDAGVDMRTKNMHMENVDGSDYIIFTPDSASLKLTGQEDLLEFGEDGLRVITTNVELYGDNNNKLVFNDTGAALKLYGKNSSLEFDTANDGELIINSRNTFLGDSDNDFIKMDTTGVTADSLIFFNGGKQQIGRGIKKYPTADEKNGFYFGKYIEGNEEFIMFDGSELSLGSGVKIGGSESVVDLIVKDFVRQTYDEMTDGIVTYVGNLITVTNDETTENIVKIGDLTGSTRQESEIIRLGKNAVYDTASASNKDGMYIGNSTEYIKFIEGVGLQIRGNVEITSGSGFNQTYNTDTKPDVSQVNEGDIWIDGDKVYQYFSAQNDFVLMIDNGATLDVANSKTNTFLQSTPPSITDDLSSDANIGDLWFDSTDDKNTLHRAETLSTDIDNGWVVVQDSAQALAELSNISSDTILTKGEKPNVKLLYDTILEEKTGLSNSADTYDIITEKTAYTNAIDDLTTYLTGLTPAYDDYTQNTTIPDRNIFNTKFMNVYAAKQALIDEIDDVSNTNTANAQSTADSKTKTYYTNTAPTEPQDGDIWVDTTDGKNILKVYDVGITDWQVAQDSYTAQKTADDAIADAKEANDLLSDISSDNKLTYSEKIDVSKEWGEVQANYTKVCESVDRFHVLYGGSGYGDGFFGGIEYEEIDDTADSLKSAYDDAYTALQIYITGLSLDTDQTETIDRAIFNTKFTDYYNTRQDVLDFVANKVKEITDLAILEGKETARQAVIDAGNAQEDADIAKADSQEALNELSGIADDGVFSVNEKVDIKKEFNIIINEKPGLVAESDKFVVSNSNYITAYDNLIAYINPLITSMNEPSNIDRTEFMGKFENYYSERQSLLNNISSKAKELADTAQGTADEAEAKANQALSDASEAQSTADGKIESFYSDNMPEAGVVGDIWFDTSNGNEIYRHNGTTFIKVKDTEIGDAIENAQTAKTTADGKATVFYDAIAPNVTSDVDTDANLGDLWVDTGDKDKLYLAKVVGGNSTGTNWILAQDSQTAQETADEKAKVFYSSTAPTDADLGDLWVDTGDDNKLYRKAFSEQQESIDGYGEGTYLGSSAYGTGSWELIQNYKLALYRMELMASDGYIDPAEKQGISDQWRNATDEYDELISKASDVFYEEQPLDDLELAYNNLYNYINKEINLFISMTTSTSIDKTRWNSLWTDFFKKKTKLTAEIGNFSLHNTYVKAGDNAIDTGKHGFLVETDAYVKIDNGNNEIYFTPDYSTENSYIKIAKNGTGGILTVGDVTSNKYISYENGVLTIQSDSINIDGGNVSLSLEDSFNVSTDNFSINTINSGVKIGKDAVGTGKHGFLVDTDGYARITNANNDLYFDAGTNESYFRLNSDKIKLGKDAIDTNKDGLYVADNPTWETATNGLRADIDTGILDIKATGEVNINTNDFSLTTTGSLDINTNDFSLTTTGNLDVNNNLNSNRLYMDSANSYLHLNTGTSGDTDNNLQIGDTTSTSYLTYDGSNLNIRGSLNADDITSGTLQTTYLKEITLETVHSTSYQGITNSLLHFFYDYDKEYIITFKGNFMSEGLSDSGSSYYGGLITYFKIQYSTDLSTWQDLGNSADVGEYGLHANPEQISNNEYQLIHKGRYDITHFTDALTGWNWSDGQQIFLRLSVKLSWDGSSYDTPHTTIKKGQCIVQEISAAQINNQTI